MIEKFKEDKGIIGYRIDRPSRLDGICFTFEYVNHELILLADMAERYRLYIHYGNSHGKSVEVYFKDGALVRGEIEPKILEIIKENITIKNSFSLKDRKNLEECLNPPTDEDEEAA